MFEPMQHPSDPCWKSAFRLPGCLAAVLVCWHAIAGYAQPAMPPAAFTNAPPSGEATNQSIDLPASVPDPLERANRVSWAFNQGLMTGVVKPTAKVYRFIVRKPVRKGIGNFGHNLKYPDRLINNLLQGKWSGARDETYRFLCNTVIGVGGLIDVASRWKIPSSEADFGQTFGQWGWRPHAYLMLPIFGPSNDRDATGLLADTAASPIIYFPPYSYFSYGITYNDLSDEVDGVVRFAESEMDPYSIIQYAWTFVRENKVADYKVRGAQDTVSLETLQSVFFTFQDPKFPGKGRTRSVPIAATGRELKFTYWLQPDHAPVVYIVPGLGSHRLAEAALALAERVYQNGYSAVCLSNPFNFEFMENAASTALPAYTPIDGHDLEVALSTIDCRLRELYPRRLGNRGLLGYSMGAFLSLYLAATQATNGAPLISFDRFVAINPPVRLLYGASKLDEFYRAPLAWPPDERREDIENLFLKVAALSRSSLTPQTTLPFDAVESKFLIGLAFRFILRDVIYTSQERHNMGVLEHPIEPLRRAPLYDEIMTYSYQEYFERFVVPYYQARGIDLTAPDALAKAGDLRTYGAGLRGNPRVQLVLNRNDFLLTPDDLAWLQSLVSPDHIRIFEQGGHLGNLAHPEVQKAIVHALDGLSAAQRTP